MVDSSLKINIVTVKDNWILPKISKSWAKEIKNCSVSYGPLDTADVNFYVNYHLFDVLGCLKSSLDVGYFTHREPAKPFDKVASIVDHCIGMSRKTYYILPREKRSLISPVGADTTLFLKKRLKLGVVSKNYPSGRKGLNMLPILSGIENVDIKVTGGDLTEDELVSFYKSIDYLLVLSVIEGGPVPVLESLLSGKPIIAPDVGWCWDFPVIKYSTIKELKIIITKLANPGVSWEESAEEIVSILEKVYDETTYKI